jgi:hypothetical protein
MTFDKMTSKIAIAVPEFQLKKDSEGWFDAYNEPYVISVAIDSTGIANPEIHFNYSSFPKVREGDTVEMFGDGHLLYGPKNPGDFVAISLLFMENDDDVRDLGKKIEGIVKNKAVDLGVKAVVSASPGAAAVLGILKELTLHIAGALKSNKDDKLFRAEGVFLRDIACPYHVSRSYTRENEFIKMKLRVIPLDAANGQGSAVTPIGL